MRVEPWSNRNTTATSASIPAHLSRVLAHLSHGLAHLSHVLAYSNGAHVLPQSNSQPAFPLGSIVSLYCSSQEVLCQIVRGISPEEPSNATVITWQERVRKRYGFYIGVGFTFLSCLLIGGSVILKKKGLIRLVATGATRAGRAPGAGGIG